MEDPSAALVISELEEIAAGVKIDFYWRTASEGISIPIPNFISFRPRKANFTAVFMTLVCL